MEWGFAMGDERLEAFRAVLSGDVLGPSDDGYEEARRVHNGLIDRRPALIVRCRGTADIVDALAFARDAGLEVSVRGGGHNPAGRAVTDGGLMIDLSLMKGICVDPDARTVRAQGGVVWRELNREAALHGLATTGGEVSTTGIAGYTLGGGAGWLMGKYGLAVDNLLSVELVTAGGEVLQASANEHPDLFWALRGGGGNFGVAASFQYRVHELPQVYGGLVAHPISAARDGFRFYRDFTADLPDELIALAGLIHAPDGSGMPLFAFAVCHAGTLEQAEEDLSALVSFGEPVMTQVGPMPYPAINMMLDDGYPRGALNYWKSTFITALEDEVIDTIVERFVSCPSPMTAILVEHFHGAVSRVGVTDTPVPHRSPGYSVLIPSEWLDPDATEMNISWTRDTYAALGPFMAKRRWLNYLDDDEDDEAVLAAYGPNYARLVEVKRRYDPDNLFHLNQNIRP